MLIQVLTALV